MSLERTLKDGFQHLSRGRCGDSHSHRDEYLACEFFHLLSHCSPDSAQYLNRKPLHHKPTAHISYHVGLSLVRQFLTFASHHTVEDVQGFTAQWVPNPHWVRVEDFEIPQTHLQTAADSIEKQLGPAGIEAVGGREWWQWRREGIPLKAEWIEMRKDYNLRRSRNQQCTRSMLYVHGGAYYFGSVDEHRYQMQRHARKLQARVLAPRYRLAPQFPFPCGLLDCLAAYQYMLTVQAPETIILAGDSAGGGMVTSLLVVLRDRGLPMPAGAILLSPWVDLTHSFPSVAGDNELDYVPAHGFIHRPSTSWPPPNSDDLATLEKAKANGLAPQEAAKEAINASNDQGVQGFTVAPVNGNTKTNPAQISPHGNLSITLDGKLVEIKDQIQLYATNSLISNPLVSPVLQPSLGGLPPLCILVGGGEMLRDEQIYLAHKAAAPSDYPPSEAALAAQGASSEDVTKWPPTYVQLQVWEDMCHVAPTLSFTRPAKFMYRSVAQFGAWALSRAQNVEIRIQDDDAVSIISSASSENDSDTQASISKSQQTSFDEKRDQKIKRSATGSVTVGKAGDDLPRFVSHMIRQRVTRHGEIFPLGPPSSLPACTMKPEEVGSIKAGPVRKWMAAQTEWNRRYAREKRKVQERRMNEMVAGGYLHFEGETPPPTALAGRRKKGYKAKPEERKKSRAMAIWSGWGSKHDEDTIQREEEKADVEKKVSDKLVFHHICSAPSPLTDSLLRQSSQRTRQDPTNRQSCRRPRNALWSTTKHSHSSLRNHSTVRRTRAS